MAPEPFSNLLTVLPATPARLPSSWTLQPSAALAIRICCGVTTVTLDEALQVGLRTRLEEMRARLGRLTERGLKKRQLALEAMNEAGLTKLEQSDFTASARTGLPTLVVTSEKDVPESYWIPQPPRLDRQTLTSDLRRGDQVAGACLGNAPLILAVRTK
jgi:Siphovirus Gp157